MPDVPVVALNVRSERHVRSWHALMDVAPRLPQGSWTVVGGSMVYLHCAERGTVRVGIPVPNGMGKAAALSIAVDPDRRRRLLGFVMLLGLVRVR